MSSPSSTNDLHDAHWPSLHPCMRVMPCSAAARSTVCSSSTSISTPTGSKRTTCLSLMVLFRSGLGRRRTTCRAALDVVRVEGLLLVGRHLVEEHVRALQRSHPPQVVQRPHLLGVEVQVRLSHEG